MWKVQIGRYNDRESAVDVLEEVRRLYPGAFLASDGRYFYIQVGAFQKAEGAETLADELRTQKWEVRVVAP
ncbi:MAG TPA: SPOR domain-containing protein [Firmicutes bacterium]|nr:SPOR domain-containing protein [Bacillota bacterium]